MHLYCPEKKAATKRRRGKIVSFSLPSFLLPRPIPLLPPPASHHLGPGEEIRQHVFAPKQTEYAGERWLVECPTSPRIRWSGIGFSSFLLSPLCCFPSSSFSSSSLSPSGGRMENGGEGDALKKGGDTDAAKKKNKRGRPPIFHSFWRRRTKKRPKRKEPPLRWRKREMGQKREYCKKKWGKLNFEPSFPSLLLFCAPPSKFLTSSSYPLSFLDPLLSSFTVRRRLLLLFDRDQVIALPPSLLLLHPPPNHPQGRRGGGGANILGLKFSFPISKSKLQKSLHYYAISIINACSYKLRE